MSLVYVIEAEQLARLRVIERGLHGNGSHLTPDARRDLANSLTALCREVQSQEWAEVPGDEG